MVIFSTFLSHLYNFLYFSHYIYYHIYMGTFKDVRGHVL
nr:MAG TPA: hypothetical protein [Caudoviricetes sp.]